MVFFGGCYPQILLDMQWFQNSHTETGHRWKRQWSLTTAENLACHFFLGTQPSLKEHISTSPRVGTRKVKVTLWLCQNSYWKWPFIVDLPIKMVILHSYVSLPEGKSRPDQQVGFDCDDSWWSAWNLTRLVYQSHLALIFSPACLRGSTHSKVTTCTDIKYSYSERSWGWLGNHNYTRNLYKEWILSRANWN